MGSETSCDGIIVMCSLTQLTSFYLWEMIQVAVIMVLTAAVIWSRPCVAHLFQSKSLQSHIFLYEGTVLKFLSDKSKYTIGLMCVKYIVMYCTHYTCINSMVCNHLIGLRFGPMVVDRDACFRDLDQTKGGPQRLDQITTAVRTILIPALIICLYSIFMYRVTILILLNWKSPHNKL